MNARLRVVIADDERPARSFLAALLRSFDDVLIVAEAETGTQAVAAIERERPDLALLDLQMPELDGIGVVRMLKKTEMPLIAFVTAYDEYAVRAFEVNAVDYLLKPVEKTRLREAINRAQERVEHAEIVAEQSTRVTDAIAAYESSSQPPYLERIPIRRKDGKPQAITFPDVPSVTAGTASIKLHAIADSGLPVQYYMVSGPAEVARNPRARSAKLRVWRSAA